MPNISPTLKVVPAKTEHAHQLGPHMKHADREEVKAASGLEPLEVLLKSLELSEKAYALVAEGEVIALGGVVRLNDTTGIPWALTSDKIALYPKQLCRITKELIKVFHKSYPLLTNFCDARNTTTIRWLKWCGFQFVAEIAEYGVAKKPFVLLRLKDMPPLMHLTRDTLTCQR